LKIFAHRGIKNNKNRRKNMKITEKYLRQVIKEELDGVVEASDITSLQKSANDITSEVALINRLRAALQGRKKVKPNEYDTLWVAIEIVLRVLETGNIDTAVADSNLRRGLELLLKSTDADSVFVDPDAHPLAGKPRMNLKPVQKVSQHAREFSAADLTAGAEKYSK
jgi:hypothetical protein